MARGTPDWGWIQTASPVTQVTDVGELAVRLGSIDRFSRSGQVLMIEDFAHGLNRWSVIAGGTGAACDLTLVTARAGSYACRIVGGSAGSFVSNIVTYLPVPGASPSGLELSFCIPTQVDYLLATLNYYDGATLWGYRLKYDDANDQLLYYNSGGTYTVLDSSLHLLANSTLFHTLKLVGDLAGGKYVRAFVDSEAYDLAGIVPYNAADPGNPCLALYVSIASVAGQNYFAYIDDVIVTQNEPA